jgi:ferrous iron transport protein A
MGLIPGTEVEITSGGYGPCRMKVRNSELVLGHGMASKILAFKAE